MKRCAKLLAAAIAVAAAILVPAAQAGAPGGNGLYGPHESFCTGGPFHSGQTVSMTLSAGNSFWIGDLHFLIREATITFDDPTIAPVTISRGEKAGLASPEAMVTCSGRFDEAGYGVVSHDVLVR